LLHSWNISTNFDKAAEFANRRPANTEESFLRRKTEV
jgi:hypothetical protein